MKMYKGDVSTIVAKDQIPAMKAGGWSSKKSEKKAISKVVENETSETKVKKTIKKKKVIKKLKKED